MSRWTFAKSAAGRLSAVIAVGAIAGMVIGGTATAATPAGGPNACSATQIQLAAGLTLRTVALSGGPVKDTGGADMGIVKSDGDMMVVSPDGRFIYWVNEVNTGGQVLRTDVASGETVLIAQSGIIEVDADGKQILDGGSPANGWRRLDPIRWMPNGWLMIGEEATAGRNYAVNPVTGDFHALDATGWFEHEGIVLTADGTLYEGDESRGGGLWKFVPSNADYTAGKLSYLLKDGSWKEVSDPKRAQATQLADSSAAGFQRIEDMEIGPDGYIYGTETEFNVDGQLWHGGRVFRFKPGTTTTVETFVAGGAGFAIGAFQYPDNIVFDNKGNLLIAEDIPDDSANPPTNPATKQFNNQQDDLWLVTPSKQTLRLGSLANSPKATPCQNEWTGFAFSADYSTLYVHQQHAADSPLLALGNYQAAIAGFGGSGSAPLPPNTGSSEGAANSAGRGEVLAGLGLLIVAVAVSGGWKVARRGRS
ncbi:MAG: alkaline phosphatase PhoX [bacterium]